MILTPQWHAQVMPPCHRVANAVSSWYIHCKFFSTGLILMNMVFDKIGKGGSWKKAQSVRPACPILVVYEKPFFF
jgi:hypothetical protein